MGSDGKQSSLCRIELSIKKKVTSIDLYTRSLWELNCILKLIDCGLSLGILNSKMILCFKWAVFIQ